MIWRVDVEIPHDGYGFQPRERYAGSRRDSVLTFCVSLHFCLLYLGVW